MWCIMLVPHAVPSNLSSCTPATRPFDDYFGYVHKLAAPTLICKPINMSIQGIKEMVTPLSGKISCMKKASYRLTHFEIS